MVIVLSEMIYIVKDGVILIFIIHSCLPTYPILLLSMQQKINLVWPKVARQIHPKGKLWHKSGQAQLAAQVDNL